MKNHLFIGLGGQGGNTIAALRKVIESRENDVRKISSDLHVKWDILYIDSSTSDLNVRKTWTHFGKDLTIQPDSFLYLKENGGPVNATELAIRPDISPWIGDLEILKKFLTGVQGIVGANQRRRFGRLLFAQNAVRIKNACQKKMEPMLATSNSCAIHIFASLAGGTGSGCIIDLITSLRTAYPDASAEHGFPIFLYLYVTDRDFPGAQVGYFHENQAASLRDLNALACEKYRPHMLGTAIAGARFEGRQPINQILLSSHLTSQNQLLSLEQQHQIVAEAAFERVFCYSTGQLVAAVQKGITGEDTLAAFPHEPLNHPERTFRFGSIGMRRWEVPIDEIREIIAADLGSSCLNNLLYRNWNGTEGAAGIRSVAHMTCQETLSNTLLNIVESQKTESTDLKKLSEKLTDEINRVHGGLLREGMRDRGLEEYERTIRDRYRSHFCGAGVDTVFRGIATARQERVSKVEEAIHNLLRSSWYRTVDPIGLVYYADAIRDCQQKIIISIDTNRREAADEERLLNRLMLRVYQWNKLTRLSRPFREAQLLSAHRHDLLDLFRNELRYRTAVEDAEFMDAVARKLGAMADEYARVSEVFRARSAAFSKRRDQLLQDLRELSDPGHLTGTGHPANRVEVAIPELTAYLASQRTQRDLIDSTSVKIVEESIINLLGSEKLTFISRLSADQSLTLDGSLERVLFEQGPVVHDAVCQRVKIRPVLEGQILDILRNKYNANPQDFESSLRSFMESSACNVKLLKDEIQPSAVRQDAGMPRMPIESMVIGIPDQDHPFRSTVRDMIPKLIGAGNGTMQCVYTHDDPTQIRMLSLAYWMAGRFTHVVQQLDNMYAVALRQDNAEDKMYFTNLDDTSQRAPRPSLLLPSGAKVASEGRAALWIGTRINAPKLDQKLVISAADEMKIVRSKPNGIELQSFGVSINEFEANPNLVIGTRLRDAVVEALSCAPPEVIRGLKEEVRVEDDRRLKSFGVASDEYSKWIPVRDEVYSFLNK
jgi:hypothetical protein